MASARKRGFYPKAWASSSAIDLNDCSAAVAKSVMRTDHAEFKSGIRQASSLTVITGRGNKSGEGGAVLPNEIREFLSDAGIEFSAVPNNPGCLRITKAGVLFMAE